MNAFTFTQRRFSARLFAVLTIFSLLLSAFPAVFFVAEATGGASITTNSAAKAQYYTGEEVVMKALRGGLASGETLAVTLTSSNGGEFSGANLGSGNCTGGFSTVGGVSIALTANQKGFCYRNSNTGPDTITAAFGDPELQQATYEITIVALPVLDYVDDQGKVTLCKYNEGDGGQYNQITVAVESTGGLQGGHTNTNGTAPNNIIPPYQWLDDDYEIQTFSGRNWDTEGQEFWEDNCEVAPPVENCDDGIQNQNETGVDTGGVCEATPPVETCDDGIENQDETGIDEGGVCTLPPAGDTAHLKVFKWIVGEGTGPAVLEDFSFQIDEGDLISFNDFGFWYGPVSTGTHLINEVGIPDDYSHYKTICKVIDWDYDHDDKIKSFSTSQEESSWKTYWEDGWEEPSAHNEVTLEDGDLGICLIINEYDPVDKITNTCLLPSTEEDVEEFEIGTSSEEPLQTILNSAGYSVDVEADQMNYQVWDLSTPNTATVTLSVKVMAKYADNIQTFGYYEAGNTTSFVPLFVIPPGLVGSSVLVSVPASVADSMGFAIQTAGTILETWYSEIDLNTGDKDNMVAYNPEPNTYILAFEDLQSEDNDYNDLVVEITGVVCVPPNDEDTDPDPVPGCMDSEANNYNQAATEDDGSCDYIFVSQCVETPNLLANASFEEPIVTANSGTWEVFGSVANWVISLSDGLELWRGLGVGASDGEQNAELDGYDATKITQTVVTVPGATYELSFDFAARSTDAADNHIEAVADGVLLVNVSTSSTSWFKYGKTFVADSSTDVSFEDLGTPQANGGTGTLLDNTALCLVSLPDNGDGDDDTSGTIGGDVVTPSSSGGGGGGSSNPVCSDLTLTKGILEWETNRGRDLSVTANSIEIFNTDDEDEVDAGSLYVGLAGNVKYEITVNNRFSKSDTCSVSSDFLGGTGGALPQGLVLGEQVSVVPYGGAAAGAGGTSPIEVPRAQTLTAIVLRNLLQVARNG